MTQKASPPHFHLLDSPFYKAKGKEVLKEFHFTESFALERVELEKATDDDDFTRIFYDWGEEFSVSFDFIAIKFQTDDYQTTTNGNAYNILHMSADDSGGDYGDRIPTVFSKRVDSTTQILQFRSSVSDDPDDKFDFPYERDQMYHIDIYQETEDGETTYKIIIDGTLKHEKLNTNPQAFSKVHLYLSSPWQSTMGGNINMRNLQVVNGKPKSEEIPKKDPNTPGRFLSNVAGMS